MIVGTTERQVSVTPFIKSLGSLQKVPIVTAAIAYDDPKSGKVFILIIHQALYFPDMERCLLCPMQVRLNDVVINERPKFLTKHPTDEDHAIILDDLIIALDIHKVSSFFHGRTPTQQEYDECDRIELTYPFPEWSPNTELYAEEESKCIDDEGYARKFKPSRQTSSVLHDEGEFIRCINALSITPTLEQCRSESISALNSDKYKLNADILCNNWGIGKTIAENTIKATTHLRVQTVNHPNVERRWPTGDRPLRYRRLNHAVYHDTMHSKVVSSRGNKCCEIYVTDFGWSRSFPMQKESEVHETLDLFLSRYGIPESLISDGAKSYTGGQYRKKAKQAGIFCKLTDPYSPWQNRAESEIREVKRLASKWTVKSQSPRRLW
jgi:transposase InsO family protein